MTAPTDRQKWQIDHFMNTDLDTIWMTLGLATQKPTGEQFNPEQAREVGQKWFENKKDELYRTVCEDWHYAEKIRDERYQDQYNLTFAISEHIKDRIELQAPLTVASLMVRLGLETPCGK